MYEDTAEPCEVAAPLVLHCSSKDRWEAADETQAGTLLSVPVEDLTHSPDDVAGSLLTMATGDKCAISKGPLLSSKDDCDLPGHFRINATRSCSLSSQESVQQWLNSMDQDAECPGECAVTVDDTPTTPEVGDSELKWAHCEKTSRGNSAEDDLTLGLEARLLDPPVSTASAGVPPAVVRGAYHHWLSSHGTISRQARVFQLGESFESHATETSNQTSISSNSIEGLLQSRTCDPEELLLSLGFGGCHDDDVCLRVPERFLQHQSQCGGVDVAKFMAREMGQTETTYTEWTGIHDQPRSTPTLYNRRMSTGSLPTYKQYGRHDPALFRGMTGSTWTTCQPVTESLSAMKNGALGSASPHSHDPSVLARSVTVTGDTNMTSPSDHGRFASDVGLAELHDRQITGSKPSQQSTHIQPEHSGTATHNIWTKRETLMKQRSVDSFRLEKGELIEDSGAKRHDNRGKMRKRSLSMPHIQCNLEPVKEESPHSSLENTLHSKELSQMLQHRCEEEFTEGLQGRLVNICRGTDDKGSNAACVSNTSGAADVTLGLQDTHGHNTSMPHLQFTEDKPGGSAFEEQPAAKPDDKRMGVVVSAEVAVDGEADVQGFMPKRKACRLSKVPNVDAESPPEELLCPPHPRNRLTYTPDDKCQSLPLPHTLPQESFELEEIGSSDVTPEEGAWPQGCHGYLPHQNSAQSDSSGFADDSYAGSDVDRLNHSLMETFQAKGLQEKIVAEKDIDNEGAGKQCRESC